MSSKLFLLLNSDFSSLNESLQEEIYREFYHLVYGIAVYIMRDHAAAEDIVQEAFIKVIYNAPPMDNEQQLRAWIKVVTKNLTLNSLRKNKKISNQADMESILNSEGIKNTELVEKMVESKISEEIINYALATINPDYRRIIELKWKKNKSNKEIALQLGLTEGAIKLKLHRARKALKKKLEKRGFQNE